MATTNHVCCSFVREVERWHRIRVKRTLFYITVDDSADKWVRERAIPLPPRSRQRVNSLYLPAGPFRAPGDAIAIAPRGERNRLLRRSGPQVSQRQEPQVA